MAEIKIGSAIYRRNLSPLLAIFRLVPEAGSSFPAYEAGQYIALRREHCRLTRRTIRPDGSVEYVQVVDEQGNPQFGAITHSYSIASAPYETAEFGYLEFYILLEMHDSGKPGRLTESLFHVDPEFENAITYYSKIAGDFTLAKRTHGFRNVVLVGTGTGLAPFVSMIKQLHHEAEAGKRTDVRYTLFHTNRGVRELGYHQELLDIADKQLFDFVYVPSVSRPSALDLQTPALGKGRANNLLRSIFEMPLREGELLQQSVSRRNGVDHARKVLDRTVRPILPTHLSKESLRARMSPGDTVILTCGNPLLMEDIRNIAGSNGLQFEQEEW